MKIFVNYHLQFSKIKKINGEGRWIRTTVPYGTVLQTAAFSRFAIPPKLLNNFKFIYLRYYSTYKNEKQAFLFFLKFLIWVVIFDRNLGLDNGV